MPFNTKRVKFNGVAFLRFDDFQHTISKALYEGSSFSRHSAIL